MELQEQNWYKKLIVDNKDLYLLWQHDYNLEEIDKKTYKKLEDFEKNLNDKHLVPDILKELKQALVIFGKIEEEAKKVSEAQ